MTARLTYVHRLKDGAYAFGWEDLRGRKLVVGTVPTFQEALVETEHLKKQAASRAEPLPRYTFEGAGY
jgi:hypothetical protein